MRTFAAKAVFVTVAVLFLYAAAYACPDIYGIPDFNCDGDLEIAVLGDSVVYGFNDSVNKGHGGYVLRTQKKLKKAAVQNLGVLGLRTEGLLSALTNAFVKKKAPILRSVMMHADIVVIDIGRNDYWLFGPPKETYANIVAAAELIRKEVSKVTKIEPIVVIANEMLPNRTGQGPWIKQLNSLVTKGNLSYRPTDLHFDTVSKKLIGKDGVHPTSAGYDALAKVFLAYLQGPLPKKMRLLHPDTDGDGLPDVFEDLIYHTDPANPDTDGDGKSDGDEVFKFHTNPLVAD